MMLDFDAIDDTLLIGTAFRREDVPALVELGVTAVISLQSEATDPIEVLESHCIAWARVPCDDFRAPSLGQIEEAVGEITRFVDDGRRVYVHCLAGLQRSVVMAACYLIASDPHRWNARSALDLVCATRRNACPLREQIDAVLEFDRYLRLLSGGS